MMRASLAANTGATLAQAPMQAAGATALSLVNLAKFVISWRDREIGEEATLASARTDGLPKGLISR